MINFFLPLTNSEIPCSNRDWVNLCSFHFVLVQCSYFAVVIFQRTLSSWIRFFLVLSSIKMNYSFRFWFHKMHMIHDSYFKTKRMYLYETIAVHSHIFPGIITSFNLFKFNSLGLVFVHALHRLPSENWWLCKCEYTQNEICTWMIMVIWHTWWVLPMAKNLKFPCLFFALMSVNCTVCTRIQYIHYGVCASVIRYPQICFAKVYFHNSGSNRECVFNWKYTVRIREC